MTTSGTAGFGLLNQHTRALVFAQSFTAGDVTIDIQLVGAIDNLMPEVKLQTPTQIECNTVGGANVVLPATITDAEGRRHTSQWSVDGSIAAVNVDTLTTFLTLGPHTIQVVAFDEDGGTGTATATIAVVDTVPPTVSIGEVCLWPPNHKQFVVDTSIVHVSDACDATPTITFVSGTSDQPSNGTGDGNTTNDIVVQPTTVCVRSERDGQVLAGRTYTVVGNIVDASDNVSAFTFPIEVPHDHGQHECTQFGGEPIDGADPRCIPSPHLPTTTGDAPPGVASLATSDKHDGGGGGCDTSGNQRGAFVSVLVLAIVLRRRKS